MIAAPSGRRLDLRNEGLRWAVALLLAGLVSYFSNQLAADQRTAALEAHQQDIEWQLRDLSVKVDTNFDRIVAMLRDK